jgi:DNA-binding NarL/FixJ family response regulator
MKLTQREQQVADELTKGRSYRVIASALGLKRTSVKLYVYRVYCKSGIHGKVLFANWWREERRR